MTSSMVLAERADALDEASGRLDRFLEENAVPASAAYVAHLVLEECMTNLVKYATPPGRDLSASMTIESSDGQLVMRLSDDGPPFDPTRAPAPAMAASLDEVVIGGLGLMLVRQMARELRYERRDGGNHLAVFIDVPA